MNAGLGSIVSDLADLDPGHLVLLDRQRCASVQWMLLDKHLCSSDRRVLARFAHTPRRVLHGRLVALRIALLPYEWAIVHVDRLLAIESPTEVDKDGTAVDLKDGLWLANKRHWVAYE